MNNKVCCWDDIEWLRGYVEHIATLHPELDEDATIAADKRREENS